MRCDVCDTKASIDCKTQITYLLTYLLNLQLNFVLREYKIRALTSTLARKITHQHHICGLPQHIFLTSDVSGSVG